MSNAKSIKLILTAAGVLILAVFIYGTFKLNRLEKELTQLELPGLSLTSQQANISLLNKRVLLTTPIIQAKLPEDSLFFSADAIHLKGINFSHLLFGKGVKAKELEIDQPVISLVQHRDTIPIENKEKPTEEQRIELGTISISNGSTYRINAVSDTIGRIELIDIKLNDVLLDPDNPDVNPISDYLITLDNIVLKPDPLNTYTLEKVQLNTTQWILKGIHASPNHNKRNYTKYLKYQNDRIALDIDSIRIEQPEHLYLKDSMLKAASIDIFRADLDVFRDKLIPRKDEYKPMLTAVIRQSPIQTDIDSIRIHNSQVKYGELVNTNGVIGEIQISDINLIMGPVRTKTRDTTTMVFRAKMMGEGLVQGIGKFPLYATDDRFTTAVHLSGLHYDRLNAFTSPNMRAVNTGFIEDAFINIYGNETNATGSVIMTYHDFKVTLMDKKGAKEKKLLSAVANAIIRKENDSRKQKTFEVDRNKERSFFNYMWLCIQKAMITAMT